ncbi:DUF1589 domain-containing protein [Rhodopirellula sp. P2]|uniref:DUF1589 domain-containing protein n=1 Tax=Rhodopirellula sp. P2 TaxID=2127060 RepID=UPI003FD64965
MARERIRFEDGSISRSPTLTGNQPDTLASRLTQSTVCSAAFFLHPGGDKNLRNHLASQSKTSSPVGQVAPGDRADALEQSEASPRSTPRPRWKLNRPKPSPGGTWPTSAQTPNDSSKSGLTTSPARRPGCTWQPSRCFGTKRGVTPLHPKTEMETQPAINHRQVEPGLLQLKRPMTPASQASLPRPPVGQVAPGDRADALEQSEASPRSIPRPRWKLNRPSTIARWNLAYFSSNAQ